MPKLVQLEHHQGVALLTLENPPVNALTPEAAAALAAGVAAAQGDPSIRAVVVAARGRAFVAGADIGALEAAAWGDPESAIDLHPTLDAIETCRLPVVMAIHASALGGGLELAMAGHHRVARAGIRLGQPEVDLGLIPGAGGTQRLPRLVGVAKALEMCVSGQPIAAEEALACGLVDAIVPEDRDTVDAAIAFARARIESGAAIVRTSLRRDKLGTVDGSTEPIRRARTRAAADRPHEEAPLKAIDAVTAAVALPFADGCRRERELFVSCVRSAQARALIHLFFATRRAARQAAGRSGLPLDAVAERLKAACVAESRQLEAEGVAPARIRDALERFGISVAQLVEPGPAPTATVTGLARSAGPAIAANSAAPDEDGLRALAERVVYRLVNEGARMVDAGEVARSSDIDAVSVRACGFPAWRGGAMLHADEVGLARVRDTISGLQRRYGERWAPAPLLERLAASGGTFRDYDRSRAADA
jgi:3-hydroxyacyl-CoA dehydrogenase